jgi:CxxC-x17-CxxC domain-containing protein
MVQCRLWEILTGMTGAPADIAGVSPVVEAGADLEAEDLLLEIAVAETERCLAPFKPTNGKPVYCSDCFEKMGGRSDSRRPERTEFRSPSPAFDQSRSQLDAVNAKLDKILNLLQPKVEVPVISSPIVEKVVEEVKEIKTPKVKKTVKKIASKK